METYVELPMAVYDIFAIEYSNENFNIQQFILSDNKFDRTLWRQTSVVTSDKQ